MYPNMNVRGLKVALIATTGLALAGCFGPDYPTEGKLDAQMVSDLARIVDIRGDIYGVQEGTMEQVAAYVADKKALYGYPDAVVDALTADTVLPELALDYPLTEDFDTDALEAAIRENIQAAVADTQKRVADEQAAIKEQIEALEATKAQLAAAEQGFDAAIAEAQARIDALKAELEETRKTYDDNLKAMTEEMATLLNGSGLTTRTYRGNPLQSYRVMNFDGKTTPETCPDQRIYMEINVIAERNECLLISLPQEYQSLQAKVSEVIAPRYVTMKKLEETIGKPRRWSNQATGLYEAIDRAETSLGTAKRIATEEHGDENRRQYEQAINQRDLGRAINQLAQLESPEYLQSQLASLTNTGMVEAIRTPVRSYIESMEADLATRFVKDVPVAFDPQQETAVFSDVSGGFEMAILAGTIVAESGGSREASPFIALADLTTEAMTQADALVLEVTRDSLIDARRVEVENPQSLNPALIEIIERSVRKPPASQS